MEPHSPVTEDKEDDKFDNVGRGSVRPSVLRWVCSRAVGETPMAIRASSNGQLVAQPPSGRAWIGAGGRHGAPSLRKDWKSANIQTTSGFVWGIPVLFGWRTSP